MTQTRVAVIGGGLAGLYAARLLNAANVDFVLVEARDRFGGRILSVDSSGRPSTDGFDLGPSWYWPRMQPAIAKVVAEMGLSSFGQNTPGDLIFEPMSREGPQRYPGADQELQSFRIAGGTAVLVSAIASALPRERIWLESPVNALELTDQGVIVRIAGNERTLLAERVIAALPPRLLEANLAFVPELNAATSRRWRETPTLMAPHAKFFGIYDSDFWREAGLSGSAQSMAGPLVEIHDATTASGHAALFGFLGVGAEQRAAIGDQALIRTCVDQLARMFGDAARRPRATLLKDWASDSFTATPADRVSGGHIEPTAAAWVSGAWADRLTLGGSESSDSEPGYLAGAVTAAARAVQHILRGLDESRRI